MATFEHYALVIPDGFYQLTFRHSSALVPDEIDCTMGVEPVGDLDQGILDDIRTAWEDSFLQNMSEEIIFEKVDARDAGGVILESISGSAGGYTGGDPDPFNCAMIIQKFTGVSGRHNRGRMYVPTVGGDNVDPGGTINPVARAAMVIVAEGFRTDCATAGAPLSLLHSQGWNGSTKPADPGNAPAPTAITNLGVAPKIGTQRRRLR